MPPARGSRGRSVREPFRGKQFLRKDNGPSGIRVVTHRGTREGVATLSEGRESGREWTLRWMSTEGRIFGQPQERNPAMRVVGSQGPEGVGKDGTKVRRVAQSPMKMVDRGPIEGPSRARTRECPKAVEGGGEGQRTMTSIGSSPHGMHPVELVAGRDPCSDATAARRGANSATVWRAASAARFHAPR
jgi:hypothetical protein